MKTKWAVYLYIKSFLKSHTFFRSKSQGTKPLVAKNIAENGIRLALNKC